MQLFQVFNCQFWSHSVKHQYPPSESMSPPKQSASDVKIVCLIFTCYTTSSQTQTSFPLASSDESEFPCPTGFQKELNVIYWCKVVCLCCFYHTVLTFGSAGISPNSPFFLPAEKGRILWRCHSEDLSGNVPYRTANPVHIPLLFSDFQLTPKNCVLVG